MFTREDGRQLYPDTVTQLMSRSVRDYNQPCQPGRRGSPRETLPPPLIQLPRARLHDLRHLHATTLFMAGEAVHVVANRLGHSDPAITLRVYAHVIKRAHSAPRRHSPRPSPGSSTIMTRTLMSDANEGAGEVRAERSASSLVSISVSKLSTRASPARRKAGPITR